MTDLKSVGAEAKNMKSLEKTVRQRWHEISPDPNDAAVFKSREDRLNNARVGQLFPDRLAYLRKLVNGKDILDVGVVAHTRDAVHAPEWLHKSLVQAANSCLGVDILSEEVDHLNSLGFNVICADITQKPLDQKFDVIVCGEVLEHLDAPGSLLESVSKMLKSDGRVVVSVPNPGYINVLVKTLFNGTPYIDNADHVTWFDPCTLCELGERHGLQLDRFFGLATKSKSIKGTIAKLIFKMQPVLTALGMRPEIFAKTLLYEFILAK
jgi:2-polyprenyl-3-methyl-5-hydroxy-6-metoxy-1,4-benzoquinol methylase